MKHSKQGIVTFNSLLRVKNINYPQITSHYLNMRIGDLYLKDVRGDYQLFDPSEGKIVQELVNHKTPCNWYKSRVFDEKKKDYSYQPIQYVSKEFIPQDFYEVIFENATILVTLEQEILTTHGWKNALSLGANSVFFDGSLFLTKFKKMCYHGKLPGFKVSFNTFDDPVDNIVINGIVIKNN
jgi:hypothetical protein